MTDPERISKRSPGLAAQLLQAGAEEQPGEDGMQRTLAALGVTAAVVTTTSTAGAVAGTIKATSAAGASSAGLGASAMGGAVKAVSTTLLVKWIGIGVVGGVGLAGAAAVATCAAAPPASVSSKIAPRPRVPAAPVAPAPAPALTAVQPDVVDEVAAPAPEAAPATGAPRASSETSLSRPVLEVGAPLAAEVAYVDRGRALLSAGQADQALALLQSYEREFPEPRLLPEVLFLRLETCDRLGRKIEARAAAQRLVDGFPKSPHASRARKLLAQ
jgi:hypothetical protein